MTSKIADFVVSMGLDGHVRSQGSISDALAKDEVLAKEVHQDQEILEVAEKEIDPEEPKKEKDGKLIVAEEIAIGHVSWSALSLYFHGMGGDWTRLFFVVVLSFMVAAEVGITLQTWWLGYWARYYRICVLHSKLLTCTSQSIWAGNARSSILVSCMSVYSSTCTEPHRQLSRRFL